MTLFEAIKRRKTTNGAFLPDAVTLEHQHILVRAASRAPSHFNSQPWKFILIDDKDMIARIAAIGGRTMTQLIGEGTFFKRYRKYFRFSQDEMDERRDGIYIHQMPAPLRPFIKKVFTDTGISLMNTLGVPKMLGEDNRKLIADSPLLLVALLDNSEYIPGELSGFYCLLSLGMTIENIWLTTTELGMGIQFVSTPMEVPEAWREIGELLHVPESHTMMAIYRLGYVKPEESSAMKINWKSNERKRLEQFVFRNTCANPEAGADLSEGVL
ncbi:MAG: nitroreductase family protein [Candidatus Kapabacteria bacterium]|nr:nitroreductase family protein [Candidatus Kapabacteria bacterium]